MPFIVSFTIHHAKSRQTHQSTAEEILKVDRWYLESTRGRAYCGSCVYITMTVLLASTRFIHLNNAGFGVKKRGKGGGHDLSIPPFSDELGYGVLQRGHGRAKIKVIQLAVWTKGEQLVPHGQNASHLCHNPACINPDHLVIETCGKNNRRVACPCWCFVPGAENQQRMRICSHDPPCLRPDSKGMADKGRIHDPTNSRGWTSAESKREVIDLNEKEDQ
jgi:hypothetical protein